MTCYGQLFITNSDVQHFKTRNKNDLAKQSEKLYNTKPFKDNKGKFIKELNWDSLVVPSEENTYLGMPQYVQPS